MPAMFRRPILPALLVLLAAGVVACSKDPEIAKREFVARGDAYVAENRYPEAIIEYRNAVQQDARFGEARLKLADAYAHQGDGVGALGEYVRAADLLADDADVQVKAGVALLKARAFDDARARADRALLLAPAHVGALVLRANAVVGLMPVDATIVAMESAIAEASEIGSSTASLDGLQELRGNRTNAEAAFLRVVDTTRGAPAAYLALANVYLAARQIPEAEVAIRGALQRAPRDVLGNRALAALYAATGREPEAEAPLRIVADESNDATGRLALADYYVAADRPADARAVLEPLTAGRGDVYEAATLRLAGLDARAGNRDAALARVEALIVRGGASATALTARAELLFATGRIDEALTAAKAATETAGAPAIAHLVLGRTHAARGQLDEAQRAFGRAVEIEPRLSAARVELARLYLRAGRLPEAERAAEAAVLHEATAGDANLLLARVLLLQGNLARAEVTLQAVARQYPDAPGVQTELGLIEMDRRNWVAARQAFVRALAVDAGRYDALSGMTRLDLRDGQGEVARARIDAALRAFPGRADLLALSGSLAAATSDPMRAEQQLREAIDINPNYLAAYDELGRLYVSQKRVESAIEQFETLSARQPQAVGPHTIVAMLLESRGQVTDAMTRYERALEIDPKAAAPAHNLARLMVEQGGNLDRALALAQTAKSGLPDRHEINDTLGVILHKRGLPALAIRPLADAVEQAPDNASYHYHLGLAHAAVGHVAQARRTLSRAIALGLGAAEAAEAKQAMARLSE